jgi:hypothetical protein
LPIPNHQQQFPAPQEVTETRYAWHLQDHDEKMLLIKNKKEPPQIPKSKKPKPQISAKTRLSKIREILLVVSSEIPKVEKPKPQKRAEPKTPLEKLIFDLQEKGIKGKMLFIEVQKQGFPDRETFIAIKNLR